MNTDTNVETRNGVLLILSSRYIETELQTQYGMIPPSFLPIGTKRLFELQISQSQDCLSKFITIPDDYSIEEFDFGKLEKANVRILKLSSMLTIEQALINALSIIQIEEGSFLRVLYGDTLILDSQEVDSVVTIQNPSDYNWAKIRDYAFQLSDIASHAEINKALNDEVFAGQFTVSNPNKFVGNLKQDGNKQGLLEALVAYSQEEHLKIVQSSNWFDFGHLKTFYGSTFRLHNVRSFNSIEAEGRIITKKSINVEKINREFNWFKNVTGKFRLYIPRLIDGKRDSYSLEFMQLPTLQEVLVMSNLSVNQIRTQMRVLGDYFDLARAYRDDFLPSHRNVFETLLYTKTLARIEEMEDSGNRVSLTESKNSTFLSHCREFVTYCRERISDSRIEGFFHGDLVTSNILWDSREENVYLIDPRGVGEGESLMGDLRYDLAKLYQSLFTPYDFIKFGFTSEDYEKFEKSSNRVIYYRRAFCELLAKEDETLVRELDLISTLLMISLIPLHNDKPEHQKEFARYIEKKLND